MKERKRFAAVYQAESKLKLDRDKAVIFGVVAMQANVEALGHGLMTDMKTLEQTRDLANAKRHGVMGFFGHPGFSENAAGMQVQRAKTFRIEGDKLVHDSYLIDGARKSPRFTEDALEYIMDMAEFHPHEFAESAVLTIDEVWVMPDGTELDVWERHKWGDDYETDSKGRPIDATNELPIMRVLEVHRIDFVNEGALTHDGMFSKDTGSGHAQHAFELVDRWREQFDIELEEVPHKVNQLLSLYLAQRGGTMTLNKKNAQPPADVLRLAEQSADHPSDPLPDIDENTIEAQAQTLLDRAEELHQEIDAEREAAAQEGDNERYDELSSKLDNIEQLAMQMQNGFNTLVQAMSTMQSNIEALDRNQRTLAGEPVVTEKVPTAPQPQLGESLDKTINVADQLPTPTHTSHKQQQHATNQGSELLSLLNSIQSIDELNDLGLNKTQLALARQAFRQRSMKLQ